MSGSCWVECGDIGEVVGVSMGPSFVPRMGRVW